MRYAFFFLFSILTVNLSGQSINGAAFQRTILPLLLTAPDARSGGMADVGLATSPDQASIYHNAAKLAFIESKFGTQVSFTPWLDEVRSGMNFGQLSTTFRINNKSSLGGSVRYFDLGEVGFFGTGVYKPFELAIELAYARKLTDDLSLGLTAKYLHSDLAEGELSSGRAILSGQSIAFDLSLYRVKDFYLNDVEVDWAFGASISNIGNGVDYFEGGNICADPIPANLGIGNSVNFKLNENHQIAVSLDLNKILVANWDTMSCDESIVDGVLRSFGDSRDGLVGELRDIVWNTGIEYKYKDFAILRTGYFNESRLSGHRQYWSVGAGLKYKSVAFDFSYIVVDKLQVLRNTKQFGLVFNFN